MGEMDILAETIHMKGYMLKEAPEAQESFVAMVQHANGRINQLKAELEAEKSKKKRKIWPF